MAIADRKSGIAARGNGWRRALGLVAAAPLAALATLLGIAAAIVAGVYTVGLTRAATSGGEADTDTAGALAAITHGEIGGFVEEAVREYTGRDFAIRGGLDVDLNWPTVTLSAKDVHFADAAWAERPEMLTIDSMRVRLDVAALLTGSIVLPAIEMSRPQLYLATGENGESNLPFPTGGGDKSGGMPLDKLPLVRELALDNATFGYRNYKTGVDADLTLDKASFTAAEDKPTRLTANGLYQGQPLRIDAEGGTWAALSGKPDKPFPLDVTAALGGFTAKATGTVAEPMAMKGVDLTIRMDGDAMPTVYPFSGVFATPTPAVDLAGHLTDESREQGMRWTLSDLDARLGRSDITGGSLNVTTGGERLLVKGTVRADRFWFDDMTSFFSSPDKGAAAKQRNSGILPEKDFWPLAAFDPADIDVDLRLGQFHGFGLAFDMLAGTVTVDQGVLRFEPLRASRGEAEAVVYLPLYSNATPVKTDVKVELNRLNLDRIAGDVPLASVPFKGRLDGKIDLGMQGNASSLSSVGSCMTVG